MGYFDDMKVMLGKGMNAADRKTQELRLQAELSRIGSSLESAYAALGKVVYSHPTLATQIQGECPGEFNAVTSLLKDDQNVRGRIEDLQRQAVAPAPAPRPVRQFLCTKCGTPVTLDLAYCPSCGDNLSELKTQYRMCPNCKTYHTSDSMFCMQCGSQTVEIPIAQAIQNTSDGKPTQDDDSLVADSFAQSAPQPNESSASTDATEVSAPLAADAQQAPSAPTCPNCGAPITSDDVFCGECGTRLV